jgi:hypothetical protein
MYDLDYNFLGYLFVMLNCLFTAFYLLSISLLSKKLNLNSFSLMFYNNIQSLPFVLLLCLYNNDFSFFLSFPKLFDFDFIICFIFQSMLAFFLNLSIYLCTNYNSPLSTSIVGHIKNIITTLFGYLFFKDFSYNFINVVGLSISLIASIYYSMIKYWESQSQNKTPISPPSDEKEPLSPSALSNSNQTAQPHSSPNPSLSNQHISPSYSFSSITPSPIYQRPISPSPDSVSLSIQSSISPPMHSVSPLSPFSFARSAPTISQPHSTTHSTPLSLPSFTTIPLSSNKEETDLEIGNIEVEERQSLVIK